MKRYVALLTLAFLAGCAGGSFAQTSTQAIANFDIYKRGDGDETIRCQGVPERRVCGSTQAGPEVLYFDCSDDEFDCIVSVEDVLAVPKAGLALGQQYSAFGARLTVEQCFIDRATCQIALISSTCADERRCGCGELGKRTTSFYYSRDRGVTAFYSVPENVASIGVDAKLLAQSLPLMTYVLVAEKGFLGAPLALPRAAAGPVCKAR